MDLDNTLEEVDVVIVHEWNDPALVAAVGKHRARIGGYHLLFHDTHHRAATAPDTMRQYELKYYDGVLAFWEAITQIYLDRGWTDRAWTWHEAADTRLFAPTSTSSKRAGDLMRVGNWGDEERSEELRRFLIEPVRRLKLEAHVYGVRFPAAAKQEFATAGMVYGGWLPNYRVPQMFSQFGCTVHIPRRPYREILAGVPTIRGFEALACGIPLICLRWDDAEQLFTPGEDYLLVDTPEEMIEAMQTVLWDHTLRDQMIRHGRQTIQARHTCAHRVDELLQIISELGSPPVVPSASSIASKV